MQDVEPQNGVETVRLQRHTVQCALFKSGAIDTCILCSGFAISSIFADRSVARICLTQGGWMMAVDRPHATAELEHGPVEPEVFLRDREFLPLRLLILDRSLGVTRRNPIAEFRRSLRHAVVPLTCFVASCSRATSLRHLHRRRMARARRRNTLEPCGTHCPPMSSQTTAILHWKPDPEALAERFGVVGVGFSERAFQPPWRGGAGTLSRLDVK
jgi:hypothetical protein